VEGEGAPTTQPMGTAGRWGKTERRSRETHSAYHLGRGWTVEGDRRLRASVAGAAWNGGGGSSGKREGGAWEVQGEAKCGVSPFYRREKAVLGLGRAREARACLQQWWSGQLAVMAADGT
jgi:hypothetical protein